MKRTNVDSVYEQRTLANSLHRDASKRMLYREQVLVYSKVAARIEVALDVCHELRPYHLKIP